MNLMAKHLSDSLNEGVAVDLDAQDWQKITEGWRFDVMQDIICNIDTPENIKKVMDCLLSLSAKGAIEPPDSFLNKCWGWCTFHSAVLESQQPAEPADNTFSIPQYLLSNNAQKMLKALEETKGYKDKPVLDRTCIPWAVSSMPDWGKAAQIMQSKLEFNMCWEDWGKLIGKKGSALKKAYNKAGTTASQGRINTALNQLK